MIPISLSYNLRHSKVLFCNKIAAKQRAPSIPKEFLRIDPSSMPRFNYLICEFLIKSYRIKESPTSLIILLARLRFSILVVLMMFLIACIPYSLIELSARLSSRNLYDGRITDEIRVWIWASWVCLRPIALTWDLGCADTFWSWLY